MTIKAVYAGGVFRPIDRVELPEGAEVVMSIVVTPQLRPGGIPAEETPLPFARPTALPLSPEGEALPHRQHDPILDGWNKR